MADQPEENSKKSEARQPEVPELKKCANCGLMFEESTMVTDASEDNLFCSHECSEKYWTI